MKRGFIVLPIAVGFLIALGIIVGGFFLFSKKTLPKPQKVVCIKAGCNSELCVDQSAPHVVSACIVRPEFACLKYSSCTVQADGKCGWTQTQQYDQCLKDIKTSAPIIQ